MDIPHPDPIWLIVPVVCIAFLLWVLWNFWLDGRRQHENERAAQPHLLVSTADCDPSVSRAASGGLYAPEQAIRHSMQRQARG